MALATNLVSWLLQSPLSQGWKRLTKTQARAFARGLEPAFQAMLDAVLKDLEAKIGEIGRADEDNLGEVLLDYFRQPAVKRAMWHVAIAAEPFDRDRMNTPWVTVHGPERLGDLPFQLTIALRVLENVLPARFDELSSDANSDLAERIKQSILRDIQRQVSKQNSGADQTATATAHVELQRSSSTAGRNPSGFQLQPASNQLPVIFLAFAAVSVDNHFPLHRLADEARLLRQIFEAAERMGLCYLVIRENVTLDDILDVFHDPRFRSRIALFHFSGHADSYSLLMEQPTGRPLFADATGFADFLANHPSLRLVFLNGCSTQEQAASLQQRGIAEIVATTEDVADEMAMSFAVRFYKALVGGMSAAGAYFDADAAARTELGEHVELPWCFYAAAMTDPPVLTQYENPWFMRSGTGNVIVGRDEDLDILHALLKARMPDAARGRKPVGVVGLAGIGKTQLALEYCRRHRNSYPEGVFWLGTKDEWLTNLASLATELGMEPAPSALGAKGNQEDDSIRGVIDYLRSHTEYLLVLDNIPDTSALRQPFLHNLTLSELPGHVLFTMRWTDAGDWPQHTVKPLQEDASLRLLLRFDERQPALEPTHVEHSEAQAICHMLGGLPLALEIAGAFLRNWPKITLADFRERLKVEGRLATLEAEGKYLTHDDLNGIHTPVVEAMLREQWEALPIGNALDKDARLILCIAGQLPEAVLIPVARLRLLAGLADDSAPGRPSRIDRAVQRLVRASLAEELVESGVRVHPLVREFAAAQVTPEEAPTFRLACVKNLAKAYSDVSEVAAQCAERGVDAVEQDLLVALTFVSEDKDGEPLITHLFTLVRLLQHEAHTLRGWDRNEQPLRFWQQICRRALVERERDLADAVRTMLVAQPRAYLSIKWLTSQESPELRRTLLGHWNTVRAVAVTPDGRRAVSASRDATLIVWDLDTGHVARRLSGHRDWVRAVTLTPDGRTAISASKDRTLKVWNIERGECIRTLQGHTGWVRTVVTTPNGKQAISGSDDNTVRIWNIDSGTEVHILTGHKSWINALAVTADNELLVSASNDGTLIVWETASGKCKHVLRGHTGSVGSVALIPGGSKVISASEDATLRVWDLVSGVCTLALHGHTNAVKAVACTADGKKAVSASYDHTLKVWDLEDAGALLHNLVGHQAPVSSICIVAHGKRVVSASADSALIVWDLDNGSEERILNGHARATRCVVVTPDGKTAISASHDSTLKVWNISGKSSPRRGHGHSRAVTQIAVSPNARWLVSASEDHTLRIWDPANGRERGVLLGHKDAINSAAITPDSQYVISASEDRTLRVWRLNNGEEVLCLRGHTDSVNHVVLTDNGQQLISASRDGTLRLWQLGSIELPLVLVGHSSEVRVVVALPGGKCVISGDSEGTIKLWNLSHGIENTTLGRHETAVKAIALMPGSDHVVSASADGIVKIWNLATPKEAQVLGGHKSQITAIVVHPDGKRIVSASGDGAMLLWQLGQGWVPKPMRDRKDAIMAMATTRDGNYLIAASDTGRVCLCDLMLKQEIAAIDLDYHVRCLAMAHDDSMCFVGDESGNLHALEFRT